MKKNLLLSLLFINSIVVIAQTKDEQIIKEIYKSSLTNSKCYSWLDYLSNSIGSRLSGSANAEKAVFYTKSQLETLGFLLIYLKSTLK